VRAPERIIRQKLDTADVLSSPVLRGCYGLKPVAQTEDHTCGAAATATVLRYLGKDSNEYQCIAALNPSRVVGVTWWPIVKYLRKRGVKARGWCHYSTDQLIENAKACTPTMVEWLDWGGHWVVCVGYDPLTDALVFADPAKPRSNFTCHETKEFAKYWFAGGTGSMAYTPAMAISMSMITVDDDSYEYSDGLRAPHVLYDWRTKKLFSRKMEHALA